jgi:hypothetical protein
MAGSQIGNLASAFTNVAGHGGRHLQSKAQVSAQRSDANLGHQAFLQCSLVGQFEIVHARFLAPLVKARGFGMTISNKSQTHLLPNAFMNGQRRGTGVPFRAIGGFFAFFLALTAQIQMCATGMNQTKFFDAASLPLMRFALVLALAIGASAEWKEKVLYSFQGIPDGAYPAGAVVFDSAGNLYGATTYGGANDCPGITQCGVVFQLQPPMHKGGAWTEHVLYVFKGVNSNDGDAPVGGVIFDQSGNLYGTTAYGGTGKCQLFGGRVGCGTVYKLVPPKQKNGAWTEQVVYSFQSGKDGYFPWGNLTFDSAGNLYGATQYGGGYGSCNAPYYQYCGTVFKLTAPKIKNGKWKEQVLYSFKGVGAGKQFGDGANPNGGLVLDPKGAIYGTTYFGGNNVQGQCEGGVGGTGCGTVFKLTPPRRKGGQWTQTLLHRFDGQDGANSAAGVVFDRNGNLYGTTTYGPPHGYGLVFELKKPSGKTHSWRETVLHLFTDGFDGGYPAAGLVFDSRGNLYGTTTSSSAQGNVFRIRRPIRGGQWDFTVLYTFTGNPDGAQPSAPLVLDPARNIYSTTIDGGAGTGCGYGHCGTVFEVSP